MEENDSAAVERARAGDAGAFRTLVERHGRNVFRLAFRMTGNEHDAEDIVQDTFLKAYRQLPRYESRSSFGTWLYRIAANCSLDLIRKQKSMAAEEVPEAIAGEDPLPDRLVFGGQIQKTVNEAMKLLTPQERTAFVLRHFEGLSIEEIGGLMGTGGSATKQSVFRAVQKLRRALEPVVSPAR
ncbi:MAG: RNA polymerase sigma factor [Bryobacteraceae bacterium]